MCKCQIRDRKKGDELIAYLKAQTELDKIDPIGELKTKCKKAGTCDIIHFHHELLKDDPERLTTDFLVNLICGEEKLMKYKSKKGVQ